MHCYNFTLCLGVFAFKSFLKYLYFSFTDKPDTISVASSECEAMY